jgi:hypothetical protein
VILFLAHRYRGMACEAHAHLRSNEPRPSSRAGDRDGALPDMIETASFPTASRARVTK